MTEFRARIVRVRMKNGGADLRLINRQAVNPDGDDWRGRLVSHARIIAESATDDSPLTGFLVFGLFADGSTSTGFRWDDKRTPIPRALLPSWLAEVVRREMVTAKEAEDVFDSKFRWVDGAS